MLSQDLIGQLPTTIPTHLMMQVISYSLLLGDDYKVVGAREAPNDEILIHYLKDGENNYCFRPLLRNKSPLLNKTQKIPIPFNPLPQIITRKIDGQDHYIIAQANKADILTTHKGQKIYYLKDSLSKSAQKVIDVEEIKVQDNTERDLTKPFDLQKAPDDVETVYYNHYLQRCEKHIIQM